jgi:hypothetical protein
MGYDQWRLCDAAVGTSDNSSSGQSEAASSSPGSSVAGVGESGAGDGESTAVEEEFATIGLTRTPSSFTLTPHYTPTISRSLSPSHGQGKNAPHHEAGQENTIPIPVPPHTHHVPEIHDQEGSEDSSGRKFDDSPTPTFHTLDTALRPHPDLRYVERQGQDTPGLADRRGQALRGEPR